MDSKIKKKSKETNWKKFVDYLNLKPPGLIEETDYLYFRNIGMFIRYYWNEFDVKDQKKMEYPDEVIKISWRPPILDLTIKKPGPYADWSIWEVIQDWELNVETKKAICLEEHPPQKSWISKGPNEEYENYCERVAEQVVEAIHSGRSLKYELQEALEYLIKRGEYICEGVSNVFPISNLPTWDEGARKDLKDGTCPWASLSDIVSEKRLKKLCNGGRPTPEELLHVAREEVNSRLEDSEYSVYGAYLYCLVGSDGRKVWGVAYQQDDVIEEFEGPFLTREQPLAAIAKFGFTDPEQVTINHVSAMLPKPRRRRK